MTAWRPSHWPLRTRVALAFLAATTVALVGLGVLVQVRVGNALEERLQDSITAEADRLAAEPDRSAAIEALGGEVHAQLLTERGDVLASSRLVAGSLLGADDLDAGWREGTVTVLDDDAAAGRDDEPEQERFVLLVRPGADGVLVVGSSREDVDETLAALRNQLFLAGVLALAVAGGLGYLVAGAGLRPIERMRARAATISSRSAGERLPLPAANDELRRLAATLNAMLERLDEGLQRERRFVAEASHDLRTPLTLMLTEVELALAQPRPPDELAAALHSLRDEVQRLIALADELLERAGAEEVGLPIEARPVDLVALATRVAGRFQAAAGDREIRVTAPRPVEILGDAVRLDRALSNLVDNALRHGAGDVTIDVRASGAGVVLSVTDEGVGFAPGATGLGLSIVGEVARAHGGTVEVDRVDDRTRVRVDLASPGP